MLGIGVGPLCSAHVRGCYGQVLIVETLEIRDEHGAAVDVVHRKVEESLDLVGVQVAGHNPVAACRVEQVGHQLCAYGYSRAVLAVLAGPAEIRNHSHNAVGGCPFRCVNHKKQFHKVVCRRAG